MIPFLLKTDYIELNKLLKVTGLCPTGGEANHLITQGQIHVNGKPETRKRYKTRVGDIISFKGETIQVMSDKPAHHHEADLV